MKSAQPVIGADLDLFLTQNIPLTHIFGFVCNEADVPGRCRACSLASDGVLNTHHWVDPASAIAATLRMQTLSFMTLGENSERAVYRQQSM